MTSNKDLANIRREYGQRPLTRVSLQTDPLDQLKIWLEEAIMAEVNEPTAMSVASVDAQGCPDLRVVLLKDIVAEQLIFYTNYQSCKAQQFAVNPNVALAFYWPELSRQIRIRGKIDKASTKISNQYFTSRPRGSQLSALASPQSQVIGTRQWLEQRYQEVEQQWNDQSIPRPSEWGGYQIKPSEYEFWQGRDSRLHDRFRYRFVESYWQIDRLAP
ncbi:MAG: pyridoxamine 5'-phosphate oxidase [Legionellales bacterium]|nr:pyridoxamine 5'-phosphate oxidase [Legionellales bacterium]